MALYSAMTTADAAAPATVQATLTALTAGSSTESDDRRLADLWHVSHILPGSLRKVLPAGRTPIDGLRRLHDAAALCTKLGVSAYALASLGKVGSYGDLSHARDIALGAVTAKYTDMNQREQILQTFQDRINILKRDALCDYIIARSAELSFRSHLDLYEFFLLDADMGGCFRTSRVVAAISTLQLYAERCRQGLERTRPVTHPNVPHVTVPPGCIKTDHWEWRKNFRVWQANRKVFLYPESYLDPDPARHQNPAVRGAGGRPASAESHPGFGQRRLPGYLTQFAELAHLRIAGSCYPRPETEYLLLLRLHPPGPSRLLLAIWDGTTWAPWRKIDLAIDARTVSAEFRRGRLYLFWVDTKCKDKTVIKDGNSRLEYYEVTISLQYSALQPNGKWLPSPETGLPASIADSKRAWNNRLLPPSSPIALVTEITELARAGVALSDDMTALILAQMEGTKTYRRVYPATVGDSVVLRYINGYLSLPALTDREFDLFHNKLRASSHAIPSLPARPAVLLYPSGRTARLGITTAAYHSEPEFDLALEHLPLTILRPPPQAAPHIYLTEPSPISARSRRRPCRPHSQPGASSLPRIRPDVQRAAFPYPRTLSDRDARTSPAAYTPPTGRHTPHPAHPAGTGSAHGAPHPPPGHNPAHPPPAITPRIRLLATTASIRPVTVPHIHPPAIRAAPPATLATLLTPPRLPTPSRQEQPPSIDG